MSTYIHYEILLFLQSACMGALLFLGYAFLTALRAVFPHKGAVVAAEDILYWLCVGMTVFARIYKTNQGILRSFLFLGILLGAWICHKTVGSLFVKFWTMTLSFPVNLVKKTIKRLLFIGKSCKLYVYNSAKHRNKRGKNKISRTKRGRQVEKKQKKKQ